MILRPTLLLDEKKCRGNIQFMADKARRNNVVLRPHFKTHQSLEIGRWFREEGIKKITTSSLKMAHYFSGDGWKDITVAFPVNILEIELINTLASKIQLNLIIESLDTAKFLIENLLEKVHCFIKIDTGYGRTGILWNDLDFIKELIKLFENSPLLNFYGFLAHAGHSYNARTKKGILSVHRESIARLSSLKKEFLSQFPGLVLSIGDTPGCSVAEDFGFSDEIRPGNFVFYDVMQISIGSCTQDRVATAMACPVVAVHDSRNTLIIYGGSVHFSKDFIKDNTGNILFGKVVENTGTGWGKIIEGAYLSKLSQEHGTVIVPHKKIKEYHVGDIIKILPIHSCTNSNLMKSYLTLEGKKIDHLEGVTQALISNF